jgi:hypothetical protein
MNLPSLLYMTRSVSIFGMRSVRKCPAPSRPYWDPGIEEDLLLIKEIHEEIDIRFPDFWYEVHFRERVKRSLRLDTAYTRDFFETLQRKISSDLEFVIHMVQSIERASKSARARSLMAHHSKDLTQSP